MAGRLFSLPTSTNLSFSPPLQWGPEETRQQESSPTIYLQSLTFDLKTLGLRGSLESHSRDERLSSPNPQLLDLFLQQGDFFNAIIDVNRSGSWYGAHN